ncbi:MAG: T9SS C-terminal target domain-containing protein [Crocinitomicaceae bacterium]|nr:T9SS C-terminal target domain-containing protein [Crocinitomicaceae bacterium]
MKYRIRYIIFFIVATFVCPTISAQSSFKLKEKDIVFLKDLPKKIKETSGLTYWNNLLWTHNDDSDNSIYGIQPATGEIDSIIKIESLKVVDWEELQHDENYFYIGDMGNNGQGNRTDLRIFKVSNKDYTIDTIQFYYPEQTDFSIHEKRNTNFDCESFLATDSIIYLFTKEWKTKKTTLYKLPNAIGNHKAIKVTTFKSKGLITGATFHPSKKAILLVGYSKTLNPFLYVIYNYTNDNFFYGKQKRLTLKERFLQVEGASFINNTQLAITNERFHYSFIKNPPQLRIIDLTTVFKKLAIPTD